VSTGKGEKGVQGAEKKGKVKEKKKVEKERKRPEGLIVRAGAKRTKKRAKKKESQ